MRYAESMVVDLHGRCPDAGESLSAPCDHCGLTVTMRTYEDERWGLLTGMDPDPCIGRLPDVWVACCGHGDDSAAYFTARIGGERIAGSDAQNFFQSMRGDR